MRRERLTATASGTVQGVGFRYWTLRHARRLGLVGWVRNRRDGRAVEVVAEGDTSVLDELEALLRRGPPGSVVDGLDVTREPARGQFETFSITRDDS